MDESPDDRDEVFPEPHADDEAEAQARYVSAVTKLTNWGGLLAGRMTGVLTAHEISPRGAAWRDLFDRLLVLRAECDAVSGLLLLKGIITEAELREAIGMEAERLADEFAKHFQGFASEPVPNGLHVVDEKLAEATMKGWPQ